MASGTEITVWVISAALAFGLGWTRYDKAKTREKMVRDLAAMDSDRREKVLARLKPELAMEMRQRLMERFHLR